MEQGKVYPVFIICPYWHLPFLLVSSVRVACVICPCGLLLCPHLDHKASSCLTAICTILCSRTLEKMFHRCLCHPLAWGVPSFNHSFSTAPRLGWAGGPPQGLPPRTRLSCCNKENEQSFRGLNKLEVSFLFCNCSGLNSYILPKFICWNLIQSVIIFGSGEFERWWGQEGWALMNRISALIKEALGVPWWLGALRIRHCHCCGSGYCCGTGSVPGPRTSTCQRPSLARSTVWGFRRLGPGSRCPHQTLNLPAPGSWISKPTELQEINKFL